MRSLAVSHTLFFVPEEPGRGLHRLHRTNDPLSVTLDAGYVGTFGGANVVTPNDQPDRGILRCDGESRKNAEPLGDGEDGAEGAARPFPCRNQNC